MTKLIIPSYIGDALYEITGIKSAWLHGLIEKAIMSDGKVPTEEEWRSMVDSMADEFTNLSLEKVYPQVTEMLAKILLP